MEVDWALGRDEAMAHQGIANLLEAWFSLGIGGGNDFEVRWRAVSWSSPGGQYHAPQLSGVSVKLRDSMGWSCKFSPTGRSILVSMPYWLRTSGFPIPDSSRSCGVWYAPKL